MIPLAQTTSAKPQDVPEAAIRFLEEESSPIPATRDVPLGLGMLQRLALALLEFSVFSDFVRGE